MSTEREPFILYGWDLSKDNMATMLSAWSLEAYKESDDSSDFLNELAEAYNSKFRQGIRKELREYLSEDIILFDDEGNVQFGLMTTSLYQMEPNLFSSLIQEMIESLDSAIFDKETSAQPSISTGIFSY